MLSSNDQHQACDLAATIRDGSLVRPVILIREDQYGTVTLTPVDRADNKLHTDLRITLHDVALTETYMPQHLQEDLTRLSCWPEDLPVEVSYE
jgi:hypothetical protein